jgi:hypothetical protein
VSPGRPHAACVRCGRHISEGGGDPAGLCGDCRAGVVRRATPAAFGAALLFAVAYLAIATWAGALASTNFVIFWLAMGALLTFGAFKVARRIAFDVFRARAMRTPGREQ